MFKLDTVVTETMATHAMATLLPPRALLRQFVMCMLGIRTDVQLPARLLIKKTRAALLKW